MPYLPETVDPTYEDVVYVPDGSSFEHYNHVCNVFIPKHLPEPAGGRPILLAPNNSGFTSTSYLSVLNKYTSGVQYTAWSKGWIVVSAKVTTAGQTTTAGGSVITGGGYYKRPASALQATTTWQEKDGQILCQFGRKMAPTWGGNPTQVYMTGRSGGAVVCAAAAMMPDFGQVGSQWGYFDGFSSRPNGVILRAFPLTFPSATVLASSLDTALSAHYATNFTTTADTYATGATSFGENSGAGDLQVNAATRALSSAMNYGFSRAVQWLNNICEGQQQVIDIMNRKQRYYLYSPGDEATIESVDFRNSTTEWAFSTDPSVNPYAFGGNQLLGGGITAAALTQAHSAWHGYAMRQRLKEIGVRFGTAPGQSRHITTPLIENLVAVSTPLGYTKATRTIDTTGGGYDDPVEQDMMEWLQGCLV